MNKASTFYTVVFISCLLISGLTSCKSDAPQPIDIDKTKLSKPKLQKSEVAVPPKELLGTEQSDSSLNKDTSLIAEEVQSKMKVSNDSEELPAKTLTQKVEKPAAKVAKKKKAIKQRPKVTFEKIRHDFGEIMQGDTVSYNFVFTNSGKGPLVINSTKVTCGCTQPSYPFVPIEPGEEGYIGVKYISVGKEGEQKPLITVFTNASKEPITLMLSGKVKVPEKDTKKLKKNEADTSIQSAVIDTLSGSN